VPVFQASAAAFAASRVVVAGSLYRGLQSKYCCPSPLECAVLQVVDAPDPQHAVPSQQNVPHAIPPEQLHCPPEHVSPAAQAWPQAPQFWALVVTSMQALPQNACPAGQQ